MTVRLAAIARYPVKGLPGETLAATDLAAGGAIAGDRRFAFAHGRSDWNAAAPRWLPRGNFLVVARTPHLAALRATWSGAALQLTTAGGRGITVRLPTDGRRWRRGAVPSPRPRAWPRCPEHPSTTRRTGRGLADEPVEPRRAG